MCLGQEVDSFVLVPDHCLFVYLSGQFTLSRTFRVCQLKKAELLVHSEVNGNELRFSGLWPKILFYKRVKWFKTFYDKIKPLI